MVDHAFVLPDVVVVDGLDAVSVRVEHECPVVVGGVLRPRPGSAVVPVTGACEDAPERVHMVARRCGEGDVHSARDRLSFVEREVVPLAPVLVRVQRTRELDRLEGEVVEPLRPGEIGDAQRHVVEHAPAYAPH